MALQGQPDQHLVTGTMIDEPTFPNAAGGPSQSNSTALNFSPNQDGLPARITEKSDSPAHVPTRTETQNDYFAASRPAQPRASSDRPKPSTKHSMLAKPSTSRKPRPLLLNRSTTITFDPTSSDSESSDDDTSPTIPTKSTSRNNSMPPEEATARRSSTINPFARLKISNEHFKTKGKVSRADGRLKLSILEEDIGSGYIAKALGTVLNKHPKDDGTQSVKSYDAGIESTKIAAEDDEMEHDLSRRLKLNIVIIIIGSRGDIQPFIRIGKILKEDYGHRVRIATHPAFKDFVQKDSGLEFFSVGGNPAELMAFMVKNPGLIPNMDTIKGGEIGRRRAQMYEMFQGMWRACINATDDESDQANAKMMGDKAPFVADAIIANPPSFAPAHIAEKLGIPLHMMFTFPYTPTVQFPHPLANIKASNIEPTYSNFMSYPLVDMMMWQGLGDLINRFRTQILHLEDISTLWAPGQLYRLKVPYTYMWSPGIIPKPKDWGPEIDVTGFVFLDLASNFTPPDDLKEFLDNGEPPVYIGFGSIVVDDPDQFTKLIFEAVKMAGVRALVSKGWGGFGSNSDCPDNVFMLENTPHDWLFPRCSAVVHHGGAGTAAIGLKCAKPTMIVPFFGDQPFWGAMVSKAKAGAHECIPYKNLTAERLAEGIKQCLTDEARENVKKIADSIEKEGDGALNAVRSFHRSLPLRGEGSMRCDFLDNRAAAWKIKNTNVKLSALAAELLVEKKKLKWNELRLIRHYEWNDFGGPGEPITGIWGSVWTSLADAATGVGSVPVEMGRTLKKREKLWEKKRKIQKHRQRKKDNLAKADDNLPNATDSSAATKDDQKQDRPRTERGESSLSKLTEPDEDMTHELAHEAAFGLRKTGSAIVRFPMNLTLALTQGFHNAPRLYGDETVRRQPRVTGLHSGLRAGRDELVYGVMDGVSGIVTHPYRGARDNGVMGAARGVGFGIGGFVLKDIAAIIGPTAYLMKGLDAEYAKKYQPTSFIRRGRIAQGQLELQKLEAATRETHIHESRDEATSIHESKEDVEHTVSQRWQALSEAIAHEKRYSKKGIIASLTGTGEKKEGQRIPRKKEAAAREKSNARITKSATTPIAKTEGKAAKPKKSLDGRPSGEGHRRSAQLNRSSTAPVSKGTWGAPTRKEDDAGTMKQKPKSIAEMSEDEHDDAIMKNRPSAQNAAEPEKPSVSEDTATRDAEAKSASSSKTYDHTDTAASLTPHNAPRDSSSERTQVGEEAPAVVPETKTMDWVKMRHEAEELLERSGPREVGAA